MNNLMDNATVYDSTTVTVYSYDMTFLSVMTLLYIPLCISSILSILALLWAILYTKSLHNSTHVLIFNVGLVDLYHSAVNLPIQISMFWTGREMFSCTLMNYMSVAFGFLSGYFYILIALNRCVTVCLRSTISKKVFSTKKTIIYSTLLWLLSFAQNFPKSFLAGNDAIFDKVQRTCSTVKVDYGKSFMPLLSLLGTAVPVTVFYFILFVYVRKYKIKIESQLGGNQKTNDALMITKLTFLLYGCFIVLLIPSFLLSAIDPGKKLNPIYFNVSYFVCQLDPLVTVAIYAGLNRPIRTVIQQRFFTLNNVTVHPDSVRWTMQSNGGTRNSSGRNDINGNARRNTRSSFLI